MSDVSGAAATWAAINRARETGSYPFYRRITGQPAPGEVFVEGMRAVNAASGDYLGLAADPRVREAAAGAARELGASCSGSPVVIGTWSVHAQLAEELADFLHRPAVLLATTGFQANLTLACLFSEDRAVISDRHIHASLVDAVRLGAAKNRRFRHNTPRHLARLLEEASGQGLLPVVLTEGAFSLGGELAVLPEIADLAGRHAATLIVDGAHDIGILGPSGRGAGEHLGCEQDIDVLSGTFSKAFGAGGGFIAGSTELIEHCRAFGQATIYSASMPPPTAAAALTALRIIRDEPERRAVLAQLADRLHDGLAELGYARPTWASPIVTLPAGDADQCLHTWRAMLEAGVFAAPFMPPAVPPGTSLLRLAVTAAHTEAHIDRILEVVGQLLPAGDTTGVAAEPIPCPA
ncbi:MULTISPECIES: pyridoxal phosphate-dependent aminotransferase family protein [unclassified Streptomyces]|uniref:aminotransferase class I/II-fold pyridoxal phosphate-dependent enzyme n=1 Tax=unclassified Streptomyces TaxID=2593676 RepID=UPI0023650CB3|nr:MULTISPECIES: pyridoxal phosphate-dependent aminotransferase family protein [unclassified Streptomyces]MDF3142283.1 pyridoxal phosphate-dependent aminotransferase family protein [Streptomyces sp. T21Q-yed]WDF37862.1 pyridoxal phosphate-dependent aminotransferase family protein [Streptomyces sp. T12]